MEVAGQGTAQKVSSSANHRWRGLRHFEVPPVQNGRLILGFLSLRTVSTNFARIFSDDAVSSGTLKEHFGDLEALGTIFSCTDLKKQPRDKVNSRSVIRWRRKSETARQSSGRHYHAVLQSSKAIAWWEIHPKEPGIVVPMKAVA